MSAKLHATSNAFRSFRIATALSVSIVLLLAPTAVRPGNAASQSDTLSGTVQATAENSPGLRETRFSTQAGTLSVFLSDEMAPGDTLTGSVVATPSGRTDDEREKNRATLANFVVNVGGQLTSAARGRVKLQIPAEGAKDALQVALRDNRGRELSRLDAPVLKEAPRNAQADFQMPSLVQQGRPGLVRGPFDGDISDTDRVTLAGQPMNQLVQTQRSAVFANTSRVVGAAPLEVNEQGRVTTAEVHSVSVSLTAPQLSLQNGETTPVTMLVTGLNPNQEVSVSLKNLSPQVITLDGGNSQTIPIRREDILPGGSFKAVRTVTGNTPGGFSIIATVNAPATPPGAGAPVSSPPRNLNTHPTPTPSPTPVPALAPSPTPQSKQQRPNAPKNETDQGEKIETSAPATAPRPPSALKSAAPSATASSDVGIIPGPGGACPCGSQLVVIHMDDEDKRNANSRSGWVGGIHQDRNTSFRFCKVNGAQFSPPNKSAYAVLLLGWTCPPNSAPFTRYFDNEDTGNINSYSGDISPNESSSLYSSTTLNFCLFSSKFNPSGTPAVFPDLGVEYGVFAPGDLPGILASGYVYTDDEDGSNENWLTFAPPVTEQDIGALITGGKNTLLRTAKVKSAPAVGKLHSVRLNTSSVKGGANGSEPTMTVTLDGPAPPCGQDIYLSTSNGNVAWITGGTKRTIPGGKSSHTFNAFVGTRNVIFNRSVTIKVTVNGKEGYAGLTVRK